jgi:hypothetical protein
MKLTPAGSLMSRAMTVFPPAALALCMGQIEPGSPVHDKGIRRVQPGSARGTRQVYFFADLQVSACGKDAVPADGKRREGGHARRQDRSAWGASCGRSQGRSRALGTKTVWPAGEVRAAVVVRLSRRVSCPVPPWSSRTASAMARHAAVTPTKAAPAALPASSVTPHGSWCSWRSAKAAVWGIATAWGWRGCQAGISSLRRLPGKRWMRMESKFPGWSPSPVSMASVQPAPEVRRLWGSGTRPLALTWASMRPVRTR